MINIITLIRLGQKRTNQSLKHTNTHTHIDYICKAKDKKELGEQY